MTTMHQGDALTFPIEEALLANLTEREKEQLAEIIEEAVQMIERDDGILLVLSGLKALGWERQPAKGALRTLPVRNSGGNYIITDHKGGMK